MNTTFQWNGKKKRLGAGYIPPAPFQSHNFPAGRHPFTDGLWPCHERGQALWVLVSLENMTLEIKPPTGSKCPLLVTRKMPKVTLLLYRKPKGFTVEERRGTGLAFTYKH